LHNKSHEEKATDNEGEIYAIYFHPDFWGFYISEELNNIFIAKDGMKKPDDLIDALSVGVLASQKNHQ